MTFEGPRKPSPKTENSAPVQQVEETLRGLQTQLEERGILESEVNTSPEGIREALKQVLPKKDEG